MIWVLKVMTALLSQMDRSLKDWTSSLVIIAGLRHFPFTRLSIWISSVLIIDLLCLLLGIMLLEESVAKLGGVLAFTLSMLGVRILDVVTL